MYNELDNLFLKDDSEIKVKLMQKYSLYEFQAEILIKCYKEIQETMFKENLKNYVDKRKKFLFDRILNGDCNKEEIINSMSREYCLFKLKDNNTAKEFLINTCDMSEEEAQKFYNSFKKLDEYESQMLSEEIDTHMIDVRKNEMIEPLCDKLIESQSRIHL